MRYDVTIARFAMLLALAPTALAEGPEPPSRAGDEPRNEVIDEITVTAQKREDRLQDVPATVAVLTASRLADLDLASSLEIAAQVPNLEIKTAYGASNPTIFLRGVGLNDFNSNANGAVGLYSDEVYLAAPSAQLLQLFDLERIEVLYGPQGTLYGRNTTGGAVNLVTRKPSGVRGGYARLTYGRFDQADLEGAFELPLPGEGNGMRLALVTNHRDGLTRNRFDGGRENDVGATAGRLQVRLVPHDRLSLHLNVHGGANRAGMRAFQSRGLIDGADALGYVDSDDPFDGAWNRDLREDLDLFGASATLLWNRPGFTLTAISAYQESEKVVVGDADASPNQLVEDDWFDHARQLSQEIRLTSSSGGNLDWIAGSYYFSEDLESATSFDVLRALRALGFGFDPANGIFFVAQSFEQQTTSFALFGQLSYALTEDLTLRAGLRHTWDDKEIDFRSAFEEPGFSIPLIDRRDRVRASELSGDLGLDYRLSDSLLLFASLRRGFKSGGFNGGALFTEEEFSAVEPEFLTSLELGFKSSWLIDRLRFNASVFAYDYQDLQVFNFINAGNVPIQFLDNASDAQIEGLELELRARPAARLDVGLGLALLDARYQDFVRDDGTDFSGNRLVSSPRFSLSGFFAYSWPLQQGSLRLHADFSARDDMFFDASNTPRIGTDGYTLANARLAFESSNSRYGIALWGKNLTDRRYLTEVIDLSDFGLDDLVYGDPRTYGVELMLRF